MLRTAGVDRGTRRRGGPCGRDQPPRPRRYRWRRRRPLRQLRHHDSRVLARAVRAPRRCGGRRLVGEVAARTYELSEGETTDSIPYAYQRSCHMLRELGIGDEPETVLDAYAGDRRPRRQEAWARGPRFLS